VGEPINPEAWMWYHKHVGGERCPIVDTFWQTETGGHMITPLPGATPLVPGSCTLPLPGIAAAIVDEQGNDMPHGSGGILVVKKPWPSMIRTIWGDPERFKKSYFPDELKGYYLAGDGAVRSLDRGYFRITGRIDDVLNVSGHRMGTMEIESALVAKSDLVAEAAVVGRPDDLTGEAIVAFVVLKRSRPTGEEAKAGLYRGFGPVSTQPVWLQAIEIYLLADFLGYWIHRLFHTGAWWPFHAVHHSSEHLDWLSSVRVHPVNEAVDKLAPAVLILFLGFDPTVTAGVAGFLTFYAIFLHADVDWDFGPLRSVVATPVFHRWHHSKDPQAIDKNFAGLLPLWDILFGTYYMPRDRLPQDFGATEPVPTGYFGQLWHPFAGWFKRKGPPPQP
jgi:sterol desaturase/sphingolipid hydroxylase (fatty acid hydroxylase superfamily)